MYPTSPIPTERVRPGGVSLGLLESESEPLALMCSPIQHRAENPESTVEPGLRLCTRWNRGPKPHLLFGHVQSRRLVPQTHTIAGSWMSPHVTWTPSRRGAAPLRTKEPFCAQEATRRPPSATLLLSSAGDPSLDREPWELVHWDEAASAPPTASGLCVLSPGPVLAEMEEQVFPVYWGLSLFRGVCVCGPEHAHVHWPCSPLRAEVPRAAACSGCGVSGSQPSISRGSVVCGGCTTAGSQAVLGVGHLTGLRRDTILW